MKSHDEKQNKKQNKNKTKQNKTKQKQDLETGFALFQCSFLQGFLQEILKELQRGRTFVNKNFHYQSKT